MAEAPPAHNEIEVSVLGPGVGECIVLHLGGGAWVVIDSCRDRAAGKAAPLAYFETIGVDPATAVVAVVISHWHDDHVAAAAEVVEACTSARVVCSAALRTPEFIKFVVAGRRLKTVAGGTSEMAKIFDIIARRRQAGARPMGAGPDWTLENQIIWRRPASAALPSAELHALSPSAAALSLAMREFGQALPKADNSPKRNVVRQQPNHVAVALWASIGNTNIILGSDLENTPDASTGWKAVVASDRRPPGTAACFKIPHHGSPTGHNPDIWTTLVARDAFAVITPYRRCNLPSDGDIARVRAATRRVFMTAPTRPSRPPRRDAIVERMTNRANRGVLDGRVGRVSIRAPVEAGFLETATVTLPGAAYQA